MQATSCSKSVGDGDLCLGFIIFDFIKIIVPVFASHSLDETINCFSELNSKVSLTHSDRHMQCKVK